MFISIFVLFQYSQKTLALLQTSAKVILVFMGPACRQPLDLLARVNKGTLAPSASTTSTTARINLVRMVECVKIGCWITTVTVQMVLMVKY